MAFNNKPLKCRCTAFLPKCDFRNEKCPASTYRLAYDTQAAMLELHDAAEQDKSSTPERT